MGQWTHSILGDVNLHTVHLDTVNLRWGWTDTRSGRVDSGSIFFCELLLRRLLHEGWVA